MTRFYLLTALGGFALGVASTAAVGSFLIKRAPAPAATADATPCPGKRPTAYYMEDVAPTLPPHMRNPFQMPVIPHPHYDQGQVAFEKLTRYTSSELECWAFQGDKIAAFAFAVRTIPSGNLPEYFQKYPLNSDWVRRNFFFLQIAASECVSCKNYSLRQGLVSAQASLSGFLQTAKLSPKWSLELEAQAARNGHGISWYDANGVTRLYPAD